jgi:hypothetical protein
MDLIKMPLCKGYTQILRVVDHLSKYGYVARLKSKDATECTNALLRILSGSIMPKILQSDNGGEVSIFNFFILTCIMRYFLCIKFHYYISIITETNLYHFLYLMKMFFKLL